MITLLEQIADMEARVEALDLKMAFVLRRADVSQTTWAQWKREERRPMKDGWDRVVAAVKDLEARLA